MPSKEQSILQKKHMHEAINAMLAVIESFDLYTLNHSKNVANYALLLAEELNLSLDAVEKIYYGAMFHDIGKIGIPLSILSKEGELSPKEYEIIKSHPLRGVTILEQFSDFKDVIEIVRHHHEHFDGSGYPVGLVGKSIPLGARLVAVVDAYDAITTNRSYRNAQVKQQAIDLIQRDTPAQFDPEIVAAFVRVAKNL
jgi:putative nucleotidyltransferase with HDIG domain